MIKYTGLFLDFDGTLYDSYPQILRAMSAALRDFQLPTQKPEEMLRLLKASVSRGIKFYANQYGSDPVQLHERFHVHHMEEGFFPPYKGLEACLTRLRDAGAHHYLYTHRDHRAWEQLERDGLRRLFDGGVTSDEGFPQKPSPDALMHLMARYGLEPESCAMLGDRDIDIFSGQNAGMAGILFDPDHFYPALKVEGRVTTMDELCDFLLNEN